MARELYHSCVGRASGGNGAAELVRGSPHSAGFEKRQDTNSMHGKTLFPMTEANEACVVASRIFTPTARSPTTLSYVVADLLAARIRKKTASAYVTMIGRVVPPIARRLGAAGGITSDGEKSVILTRSTVAIFESDVPLGHQVGVCVVCMWARHVVSPLPPPAHTHPAEPFGRRHATTSQLYIRSRLWRGEDQQRGGRLSLSGGRVSECGEPSSHRRLRLLEAPFDRNGGRLRRAKRAHAAKARAAV
jgi:hypothetical protein